MNPCSLGRSTAFSLRRVVSSTVLFTVLCLGALPTAQAISITFDLRGSGVPDDVASGTMIVSGLTATLAANDGDLNQTTSAFGINASGAGDDTDGIDGGSGATEKVTVSFNADLFVTQIVLASLSSSASDSASLSIAGTAFPSLTDTGSGQDVFNFNANNALATGQTLEIGWISGNGFSFESFTVETRSQKNVPDSSATLTLLITAFLCLSGLHKKITSTQTQNGLSGPCPG